MTKLCDFPYPIYYVTKNLISYLWPDSFCCWLYYLACVAGVKQGRGRQSADGKGGRDEEVASSKKEPNWSAKTTWFDSLVKLIPYLWPKRLKTNPFGASHTYVAHIREYPFRGWFLKKVQTFQFSTLKFHGAYALQREKKQFLNVRAELFSLTVQKLTDVPKVSQISLLK